MRLRETTNEFGTPVVEYRCETCRERFTVCPAPAAEEDDQWNGCTQPECASYDPERDVDKCFDEGKVKFVVAGERVRLVPFRVVGGTDQADRAGESR
jgi:hypothetical protein